MLRKVTGSLAVLCVIAVALVWSSRKLEEVRERRARHAEFFPNPKLGRLLTAGFASVVGDWWWVKTINYYGSALTVRRDEKKFGERIADIEGYLKSTTGIEPFLLEAYYFGGVVMGWDRKDPRAGIDLMRYGLRHHPENWKLWYYTSFNHFYFLKEFKEAADLLLRGTLLPTAPVFFVGLAEKIYRHADFMRMAMDYLYVTWSETKDPKKKEEIALKMHEYGSRLTGESLDEKVRDYRKREGRWPATLEDLVGAGLIDAVPEDPLGGRFELGPDHKVTNPKWGPQ